MFGMSLMALKDLEPGFQEALELWIGRRRNERRLQCAIDLFVIGNLIRDIGFVELLALELAELSALCGCLFGQCTARIIVFRRHFELLYEIERLLVHRGMITKHILGKPTNDLAL